LPPQAPAGCFEPPAEYAGDFGGYRSVLQFEDGSTVRTPRDWNRRRQEILVAWHGLMGAWPPLLEQPRVERLGSIRREDLTQEKVRVEIAPAGQTVDGYLLRPDGPGPFAGVLVVYYDAETGIGQGKELRDFAYQLTKRGFVTLSVGTPEFASLTAPYRVLLDRDPNQTPLQPLSALAYVAANCHTAMSQEPGVDGGRIGVVGHSYGGKWAMFASCLYEKFACGVWSDPGIVFDESRPNVNYWEPWYLGCEAGFQRPRGVPDADRPRTGPYRWMIEHGWDLHELHALMAPRPFLVSGGSEDPPMRWRALNHCLAVNRLLGYENRVAMTNRPAHDPTAQSNEQIYAFLEHFLGP